MAGGAATQGDLGVSVLKPPPLISEPADDRLSSESSTGEEGVPWTDKLKLSAFVDAYFSLNANFPKPQNGANRFRAFDADNGFGLSWTGLDLTYDGDTFAGTVGLRFGPTAERYSAEEGSLNLVKQAYATWKPSELISVDVGKFDTIYGAEVAESQLNFNYTRGILFNVGQPFFHTGLRANLDVSPNFWITGLVVNGWNNSVDNNLGKTFGLQVSSAFGGPAASPMVDLHLGYLVGPEQSDRGIVEDYCGSGSFDPRSSEYCNDDTPGASADRPRDAGDANSEGLRHFVDFVAGVRPTSELSLSLNADYGTEKVRQGSTGEEGWLPGFKAESWWGVAVAGRLQVIEQLAAALRFEVYGDPDGRATPIGSNGYVFDVKDLVVTTYTATLDYAPSDHLVIRLEPRLDYANDSAGGVFQSHVRSFSTTQFTTTLGVVATTN